MNVGRARRAATVVAITCLATTACSVRAMEVEASGERLIAVSGVASEVHAQALFQGSLTWSEHECLVTQTECRKGTVFWASGELVE